MRRAVFVTGGTGYLGRALVVSLVERGHAVTALVRAGSESKLPSGARAVAGDALALGTWASSVPRASTFVHLIGTPKPAPWKAREFERVDFTSVRIAIEVARAAEVEHFVYLSVARPAPVMRAYQAVRERAERAIVASGLDVTFVRPWYVLGPGHRWPIVLWPLYAVFERIPATRESARRLGFVTLSQMTNALVAAIENPARGARVLDVSAIRGAEPKCTISA